MRSFSLLQESIVPYIPTLIGQLTHKLLLVSKVCHTRLLKRMRVSVFIHQMN